jgi:hypothetical protein
MDITIHVQKFVNAMNSLQTHFVKKNLLKPSSSQKYGNCKDKQKYSRWLVLCFNSATC